jgi:prepilin-type N-terminal cleavage/methylation domain-containing protein
MQRPPRRLFGFTLIELLTVMAIIAILAALVLTISGYAQKVAALNRARGEIKALSLACESYKTDNGIYPHQALAISGTIPSSATLPFPSDLLDPRSHGSSSSSDTLYTNASLELYEALTGDLSCSGSGSATGTRNYIPDMKPDTLGRNNPTVAVSGSNQVTYLSDPFGNSYGYSTANSTASQTGSNFITGQSYTPPTSSGGYNPTFDLWCTGGQISNPYTGSGSQGPGQPGDPALQWVTNWGQ